MKLNQPNALERIQDMKYMMWVTVVVMLAHCVAGFGCAATTGTARPFSTGGSILPSDFRARANDLQTYMTKTEVRKLLGRPTRTETSTHGSNTPEPWSAESWDYVFGRETLTVIFAENISGANNTHLWGVNNWSW